jgi:hypothetical protein
LLSPNIADLPIGAYSARWPREAVLIRCGMRPDKKESCSFLKKRTKKLLSVASSAGASHVRRNLGATDKSFLVLFFKKELFSFFRRAP